MILGMDAWRAVGDRTGVGRNVQHLLAAWSRQELPFEEVRIFAPAPLTDLPEHPAFRLDVRPGPRGELRWQASRLRGVAAEVDLLFGQYTLPVGYRGRCVVDNLGIYQGRFAIPGWRTRIRSWHNRVSARRADLVIANSESTKADVVRYYGVDPGRVAVVWPGAAAAFRAARAGDEPEMAAEVERAGGASGRPYLLFVGKLTARRNVPALLEALAKVRERHPDLQLLIVGPNTTGVPVGEIVGRLGLDGAVRHVPFLDVEPLAALYRGARAFVLPTEHEGFSHTIPEALASGCPVITVEHAALAEADMRRAVLVVPAPDPDLLAGAILRVLDDPGARDGLVRRGLELARALSWDETARRTMELLYGVATAGASASSTTRSPVSAER